MRDSRMGGGHDHHHHGPKVAEPPYSKLLAPKSGLCPPDFHYSRGKTRWEWHFCISEQLKRVRMRPAHHTITPTMWTRRNLVPAWWLLPGP